MTIQNTMTPDIAETHMIEDLRALATQIEYGSRQQMLIMTFHGEGSTDEVRTMVRASLNNMTLGLLSLAGRLTSAVPYKHLSDWRIRLALRLLTWARRGHLS